MSTVKKNISEVDGATIRFAGDSGDGMQLTGSQFSDNTAIFGNDLATLPDFPAEIRAPKGSLAGVSSFQLQFSNKDIHTPGDDLDVLVAMNPAGLKVHLGDLKDNGMLIINTANFTPKNIQLAGYDDNPLDSDFLDGYQVLKVESVPGVLGLFAINKSPVGLARSLSSKQYKPGSIVSKVRLFVTIATGAIFPFSRSLLISAGIIFSTSVPESILSYIAKCFSPVSTVTNS